MKRNMNKEEYLWVSLWGLSSRTVQCMKPTMTLLFAESSYSEIIRCTELVMNFNRSSNITCKAIQ
jgi:hypothetical protein